MYNKYYFFLLSISFISLSLHSMHENHQEEVTLSRESVQKIENHVNLIQNSTLTFHKATGKAALMGCALFAIGSPLLAYAFRTQSVATFIPGLLLAGAGAVTFPIFNLNVKNHFIHTITDYCSFIKEKINKTDSQNFDIEAQL